MSATVETAAQYHADEGATRASISSSLIHTLLTESPRHAWANHPRLNPDYERTEDEKFDVGNVAHALILEGVDKAVRLDFPDWRTKDARGARDACRASGNIPLLAEQYERVRAMVGEFDRQCEEHSAQPRLLRDGSPEITLRFTDSGIECRARLDYLHADLSTIDDVKTTSRSASPWAYARALYQHGGDIQAAFYRRAVQRAFDVTRAPTFRWIVVETNPPYALSVIEPAADVLAVGDDKIDKALELWGRLLELEGEWPAYPLDVVRAELPPWEESRWLERKETL